MNQKYILKSASDVTMHVLPEGCAGTRLVKDPEAKGPGVGGPLG